MNRTRKTTLLWLLCLLCLAGIEGGARLIWHHLMAPKGGNGVFMVERILAEPDLPRQQTIVSHPYSLYWNNPRYADGQGRQYDDMGYRSPPYQRREDELRVLVLGGSTTNGYPYVKDPARIWTRLLENRLAASTGRPVHVFNAGLPYGTSAELMVHFLLAGRHLRPHLVIFHEGGNDVAPLMFPGYRTDYSHFRKSNNAPARVLERKLLEYSATARILYAVWLKNQGVYQAQPAGFETLDRAEATRRVRDNPSPAFESNVLTITREAVAGGAQVLLVGFLQARRENLSRNRSDLSGLEEAMLIGVDKHDALMRNIAAQQGQRFLKLDAASFRDEWFLDNCHLIEEGEAEKARQIHLAAMDLLGTARTR